MRYSFTALAVLALSAAGCSAGAGVAVEPQVGILEAPGDGPDNERVWVCHRGRWQ